MKKKFLVSLFVAFVLITHAMPAAHYEADLSRQEAEKKSTMCDKQNKTPLHYAAMYGKETCLDFLISHNATTDTIDSFFYTPLHYAAMNGHLGCVQKLMQAGAPVNATDRYRRTPLQIAAKFGHTACVQALLDAGAYITLQNSDGETALHRAVISGNSACVALLIEHGAHVNARDNYGKTPLHLAAINGYFACVQILLAAGADQRLTPTDGVYAGWTMQEMLEEAHREQAERDAREETKLVRAFYGNITITKNLS